MASRGRSTTTRAKLTRESKLRERRLDKQARKVARKQASADHPGQPGDALTADSGLTDGDALTADSGLTDGDALTADSEPVTPDAVQPGPEPVVRAHTV